VRVKGKEVGGFLAVGYRLDSLRRELTVSFP